MRSMTGFGAGEAALGGLRVSLELRAVNHRYLDVRVRLPRELTEHSVFLEQRVRAHLARGRVDLSGHLEGAAGGGHSFDEARARAVLGAMQRMADALGYTERVPLTVLGAMPELYAGATGFSPTDARAALDAALTAAVAGAKVWRNTPGHERMRILLEAATLADQRAEAIAQTISAE
ncbi:MAG: hypothetical protein JWM10_2586, partial [Myxococcaceae bacterium]|nr:hypothetical protein [Myxococcaceae bacterium]